MKHKQLLVQAIVAGAGAWIGIALVKVVFAGVPVVVAIIAAQVQ